MSSENKLVLSARENEVLAIAWQCFQGDPKVDIPKLAALTGVLGRIRTKLKQHVQDITVDKPTPLKSCGRPRKKRAAEFRDDEEEVEEEAPKPKKRRKVAESDAMLGLGKKSGGAVKVKSEPEEMGCDMSGDDEGDAEI